MNAHAPGNEVTTNDRRADARDHDGTTRTSKTSRRSRKHGQQRGTRKRSNKRQTSVAINQRTGREITGGVFGSVTRKRVNDGVRKDTRDKQKTSTTNLQGSKRKAVRTNILTVTTDGRCGLCGGTVLREIAVERCMMCSRLRPLSDATDAEKSLQERVDETMRPTSIEASYRPDRIVSPTENNT